MVGDIDIANGELTIAARGLRTEGLVAAGRPGELCGLGGTTVGLGAGLGKGGGLWHLIEGGGSALMTLVAAAVALTLPPPPSNTPDSSSLLLMASEMTSCRESGLGGAPSEEADGISGLTRSGEEVLVSATDSPTTGQRYCLKTDFAEGCLICGDNGRMVRF